MKFSEKAGNGLMNK